MAAITVGAVYRLKDDFGVGIGRVPAGSDVTVTGIYPPGTPGIGAIDEDTVLADYFNAHETIQTIAIGVTQFAQLCREVPA